MNYDIPQLFIHSDPDLIRRLESLPEPSAKVCRNCGERFYKRPMELRSTYYNRTTCCQTCAAELKKRPPKRDRPTRLPRPQKPIPPRRCAFCDAELVQRENEPECRFAARQTCNRTCGARLRWTSAGPEDRHHRPRVTDEEIERRALIILARMEQGLRAA